MVPSKLEKILESEKIRNLECQYANYVRASLEEFDKGDKDFFELRDEVSEKAEEIAAKVTLPKGSSNDTYEKELASYLQRISVGDEIMKRHQRYLKEDKGLFIL